jgi:hypothetical protein
MANFVVGFPGAHGGRSVDIAQTGTHTAGVPEIGDITEVAALTPPAAPATYVYALSSFDATQPAVFLTETQSDRTNMVSGVGAVTESVPAPPAPGGGGDVQVFIVT